VYHAVHLVSSSSKSPCLSFSTGKTGMERHSSEITLGSAMQLYLKAVKVQEDLKECLSDLDRAGLKTARGSPGIDKSLALSLLL